MHEDEDFLTALSEKPNDNVTRLVYADWLDEQDDPRAEFVRLEVRLATEEVPDDQRRAMMNRLAELGRRAERGWLLAVNRSPFVRCAVQKVPGGSPLVGRVELANYATKAITAALDVQLLPFLRLTITDPFGGVTEGEYEEFPTFAIRMHPLNPGERRSVRMNLLNTIPADQLTVGAYTVEVMYDNDGVQSRADPVRVELTDEDRRKWRLGRFARG